MLLLGFIYRRTLLPCPAYDVIEKRCGYDQTGQHKNTAVRHSNVIDLNAPDPEESIVGFVILVYKKAGTN